VMLLAETKDPRRKGESVSKGPGKGTIVAKEAENQKVISSWEGIGIQEECRVGKGRGPGGRAGR